MKNFENHWTRTLISLLKQLQLLALELGELITWDHKVRHGWATNTFHMFVLSTSPFAPAVFHVLDGHMWPVATTLDNIGARETLPSLVINSPNSRASNCNCFSKEINVLVQWFSKFFISGPIYKPKNYKAFVHVHYNYTYTAKN